MVDKNESKIKIFYNNDLSLSIVYFEIVVLYSSMFFIYSCYNTIYFLLCK